MPKFCTNCGSPLIEGARFCNKCGAQFAPTQPTRDEPPFSPPPQSQAPPSQPPAAYQPPPSQAGLRPNVAGLLCYVFWLVTGIIFLALEPYNKDRFVRFHAFQSIFFSIAVIILRMMRWAVWEFLPWPLYSLLYLVVSLGIFVLWILLMYKAYHHEQYKLPVIGDLAMQQAGR